MMGVRMPETR